jgi:hypothetical protein
MKYLHSQRDQVLACDADTFIGNTLADLAQYLERATTTQVQNWLYTWKPFMSLQLAKELSLHGI